MARLVIIAALLAVAFVAAAEGRVVHPILTPLDGASPFNASSLVDGTNPFNASSLVDGRKLTGADENANMCDHVCTTVTFKKVCYGLTKLPGVTTPRSLLEAAVRVSLGKARMARARFAEAMRSSHEGNPMASILESCGQNYDDLVSALEEAQQSIGAHGTNANLVSKMTAASTYAGDCDTWFGERKIPSPYEVMQRHVARVVSITLGIAAKTKQL